MIYRLAIPAILLLFSGVTTSQYGYPLFRCTTQDTLLPSTARCDGYPDCPGGEDELGCEQWFNNQWKEDMTEQPQSNIEIIPKQYQDYPPSYSTQYQYGQAAQPVQGVGYASQHQPHQYYQRDIPAACLSPPPTSQCPVYWITPSTRWFYNSQTQSCEKFLYTCGNGYNNFDTVAYCTDLCMAGLSHTSGLSSNVGVDVPLLTSANFDSFLSSHDHVLVEFFAVWCGACTEFNPKFEKIATSVIDLEVHSARVNIDTDRDLALKYGVDTFPRVLFFSNLLSDCPRRYYKENGLEANNIIVWVTELLKLAQQDNPEKEIVSVQTTFVKGDNDYEKKATQNVQNPSDEIPTTPTSISTMLPVPGCAIACTYDYRPVCGSNTVTYNNLCLLELDMCETKTDITVLHDGKCEDDAVDVTTDTSVEEITTEKQNKKCNKVCNRMYQPVCGSDGSTYNNLCMLKLEACLAEINIEVVYSGRCEEQTKGRTTEQSPVNTSKCRPACTREYMPVCGDNGKMYNNKCLLELDACENNAVIAVVNGKQCESIEESTEMMKSTVQASTNVPYNPTTIQPKACNTRCTKIYIPVCGTNQKTYSNSCMMDFDACKNNIYVEVAYNGACVSNVDTESATEENIQTSQANTDTANYLEPRKPIITDDIQNEDIKCNSACPRIFFQVCGTNGRTYNNLCMLELDGCRNQLPLARAYDGKCREDMKSANVVTADAVEIVTLKSTCEQPCAKIFMPVCGSNKISYGSLCLLNNAICTDPTLQFEHSGPCEEEIPRNQVCTRTEYTCVGDRSCISYIKRCDGRNDCLDGSDELGCEGECSRVQFRCEDLGCIEFGARCDRKFDCSDNSDELDCPLPCKEDQFTCNDGTCIAMSLRCNRRSDCYDRTDEIGCQDYKPSNNVTTVEVVTIPPVFVEEISTEEAFCNPSSEFTCADRRLCIQNDRVCDGYPDCGDISDEKNCARGSCNSEWLLQCRDGSCIDVRRRCDGYNDCSDGVDESDCLAYECQYWQIKCVSSGVCVHRGLECNGVEDCDDGSDEGSCPSREADFNQRINQDKSTMTYDRATTEPTTNIFDSIIETSTRENIFGFDTTRTSVEEITTENQKRKCNKVCNRMYQPVCGSDGSTYNNLCMLNLAACLAEINIEVVYSGRCEQSSSTEDASQQPWATVSTYVYQTDVFNEPQDKTTEENVFGFDNDETMETTTTIQAACQTRCKKLFLPVCGSNGKTYTNVCLMELDACRRKVTIEVLYEGDCIEVVNTSDYGQDTTSQGMETGTGGWKTTLQNMDTSSQGTYTSDFDQARTTVDDYYDERQTTNTWTDTTTSTQQRQDESSGITMCRTKCPKNYSPVCGSDGNTYNNLCLMELSACNDGTVLSALYNGPCLQTTTEEMQTTNTIQEETALLCPETCPSAPRPVCGSDNVTYTSACHLRQAECRSMMVIIVQHAGACQATGREDSCPSDCPSDYQPVCGSDGVTYDNYCRMQEGDCRSDRGVTLNYEGSCTRCHPMLEWMCGDASCVNTTTLCDGNTDCPDGTDESFCSFICFNGEEISLHKNCDGVPDCPDGEDENNCLPFLDYSQGDVCDPLDQYECKEGVCISMEKVCDGVTDCIYEDDEFDCTLDKIDRYSYSYNDDEITDPVVYDTEYDQLEDSEEEGDWSFGLWK